MIESGTLLQNRYRVVRQIGQGGMGAVYVAIDERFNSTVAVKQTFFDDPALRKAFEREAHLLNHLRHTALPRVSDHFTEAEGQFLVMELIEGSDISDLHKQRGSAFPLADVLRWADELLDALDYLHTHEPPIVHRDIKPQNLKLTPRGQIVLLDFGLAKGTSTQTRADVTASIFGYSRNYAPLEQIQGTGTDARSDLYSLGATLYHMLTGAPPVDALTRASAIVNGQPDPLRPAHVAHAQVPAAVGEILKRAMSQNAAHRHSTAAEMRVALRQAANAFPNVARQNSAVFAQSKSARDVATVVEPLPQATSGKQLYTHDTSQLRRSAPVKGETTVVGAPPHVRRQAPPATSIEPPQAGKSPVMIIGVALAVVVACALIAFPLMRRPVALPASAEAPTATSPGAASDAQPAYPNTGQAEAARETSNPTFPSEIRNSSSPAVSASSVGQSSSMTKQAATGEAEATSIPDVNAGGGSAGTDGAKSQPNTVGSSANNSGLVMQLPPPNSQVGNKSAAEYDAQRAEDLRRRQQQQEQQLQEQRQREQQQYGPPPPEDRFGPPPVGGGRRPLLRRPPPF